MKLYTDTENQIKKHLKQMKFYNELLYFNLENLYDIVLETPFFDIDAAPSNLFTHTSIEESISFVAGYLKRISPKYREMFYDDLKHGNINFNSILDQLLIRKDGTYEVGIHSKQTLSDSRVLLHEYLHRLNCITNPSNHTLIFFTEQISITGEFMFLDFLIERGKSLNEIEMLCKERKITTNSQMKNLLYLLPFYLEVKEERPIGENIIDKYQQGYSRGKIGVHNLDIVCSKINKNPRDLISCYFGHATGTIYSQFLLNVKGIDEQDLYYMNENISHMQIDQYNETFLAYQNIHPSEGMNKKRKQKIKSVAITY